MLTYPPAYEAACRHLVAFGSHSGDTKKGRSLCATALRELRTISRDIARTNRKTLYYISGQLPVKPR